MKGFIIDLFTRLMVPKDLVIKTDNPRLETIMRLDRERIKEMTRRIS